MADIGYRLDVVGAFADVDQRLCHDLGPITSGANPGVHQIEDRLEADGYSRVATT